MLEVANEILNNHLFMVALAFYSLGVATKNGVQFLEEILRRVFNIRKDENGGES